MVRIRAPRNLRPPGLALLESEAVAWFDAENEASRRGYSISDPAISLAAWTNDGSDPADLEQATGASQPVLTDDGTHTLISFDGVDDWMQTAAFAAALPQPNTIIAAGRYRGVTGTQRLYDGTVGARHLVSTNADQWQIYGGVSLLGGVPDVAAHVWSALYDGVNSSLHLDGGLELQGDAGTQGLTALSVGSEYGSWVRGSWVDLRSIAVFDRELAEAERSNVESFLNDRYSLGAL